VGPQIASKFPLKVILSFQHYGNETYNNKNRRL
jgi:hypothetical protein